MDSDQNQHVGQRQSQGNDRNSKSCARLWHSGGRRFRWAARSAAHSEGDLEVTGIETKHEDSFLFCTKDTELCNYIYIMSIRNTTISQAAMNTNKPFQIWRFEDLL